jgi:hypothetical protein
MIAGRGVDKWRRNVLQFNGKSEMSRPPGYQASAGFRVQGV